MSEATDSGTPKAPRRRTLKGHVVSDKMDSTIIVAVNRRKRHPLYEKIITRTKKYLAHDGKGEAAVGDLVIIEESRPLSKRKRWRLIEVLEKAR